MKNSFFAISLFVIFSLSACGVYSRKELLPDGKTWKVEASEVSKCGGITSTEVCLKALLPRIKENSHKICSNDTFKLYDCEKYNLAGVSVGVACKLICDATE